MLGVSNPINQKQKRKKEKKKRERGQNGVPLLSLHEYWFFFGLLTFKKLIVVLNYSNTILFAILSILVNFYFGSSKVTLFFQY